MTLYVRKSHKGQYIRPFSKVGIRSRFNLATISFTFSPGHGKRMISQRSNQTSKLTHMQKVSKQATDEATIPKPPLKFSRTRMPVNKMTKDM